MSKEEIVTIGVKIDTARAKKDLEAFIKSIQNLTPEIKDTEKSTKRFDTALDKLSDAEKAAATSADKLSKSTEKLSKKQKKGTTRTKQQADAFKDLKQATLLVNGPLSGIGSRITTLTAIIKENSIATAGFIVTLGALGFALGRGAKLGIENQDSMIQLRQVIQSTGGVAGVTAGFADTLAQSFENLTKFSKQEVIAGQAVLLTFTKIGRDVFPDVLEASLDLSTALGTGLQQSIIQVGKALQDPVAGFSALARSGVSFSEQQKELIKNFVATGNLAKAQAVILSELKVQFEGSAKAARDSLGGALAALGNRFNSIIEFSEKTLKSIQPFIEGIIRNLDTLVIGFTVLVALLAGKVAISLAATTAAMLAAAGAVKILKSLLVVSIFGALVIGLTLVIKRLGGFKATLLEAQIAFIKFKFFLKGAISDLQQFAKAITNLFKRSDESISKSQKRLDEISKTVRKNAKEQANFLQKLSVFFKPSEKAIENFQKQQEKVLQRNKKINKALQDGAKKLSQALGLDKLTSFLTKNLQKSDSIITKFAKLQKGKIQDNLITPLSEGLTEANKKLADELAEALAGPLAELDKLKNGVKKVGDEGSTNVDKLKGTLIEFGKTAESIADGMAMAFDGAIFSIIRNLEISKDTLKNFADSLKDTFARTAADIVQAFVKQEIIIPVVVQAAGSIFGGGTQLDNLVKTLGGGADVAGGFAPGGGLGDLFGTIKRTFKGFGGPTPTLKPERQLPGSLVQGPNLPPETLLQRAGGFSGLASGGLQGASIGATIGSLTGGNVTGSTIGGTVGGTIGSVFGPFGKLLGSTAGGFIGGALGGEDARVSEFAGGISGTGRLEEVGFGSKEIGIQFADALSRQTSAFLETISNITDVSFTGLGVRGSKNTQEINALQLFETMEDAFAQIRKTSEFTFDPNDPNSISGAINQLGIEALKASEITNGDLRIALQNIQVEGRTAGEILSDLSFAANFQNLGQLPTLITQMEQAVIGLDNTLENARAKVIELGLSEEKLVEIRASVIGQLAKDFNKSIKQQILQITNPVQAELNALDAEFATRRRNAFAITGDIVKVEQFFSLRRKEIIDGALEEQMSSLLQFADDSSDIAKSVSINVAQVISSLDQFGRSLRLDPQLSGTSRQGRAMEADIQIADLLRRVEEGDPTVFKDIETISNDTLKAQLDYYGNTQPFIQRFKQVEEILEKSRSLATTFVSTEDRILTENQSQTSLLSSINENIVGLNALQDMQQSDVASLLDQAQRVSVQQILAPGETQNILSQINTLSDITIGLDRRLKVAASQGEFAFDQPSTTQGGFRQFVQTNREAGETFLRLLESVGGDIGRQREVFGFANGTGNARFGGGMAVVGERGPELLNFGQPVQIFSNAQSEQIMQGARLQRQNQSNNDVVVAQLRESNQNIVDSLGILSGQMAALNDKTEDANDDRRNMVLEPAS